MGLFDFLKKQPKVPDAAVKVALAVFPGGQKQIASEGRELHQQLNGTLTEEELRLLLPGAKALVYISNDRNFARCRDYIITRSGNKLSDDQAFVVNGFLCGKLGVPP